MQELERGNTITVHNNQSTYKKHHKKRGCRQICSTGWSEMHLSKQILLQLALSILLLFLIYFSVLLIIFEGFYKPDVLLHFSEELAEIHSLRTSNMTVSIASRFESFNQLTKDNAGKIVKLMSTTQRNDFNPHDDLPYKFIEKTDPTHCSVGVPDETQYLIRNFAPLWQNMLKLKLSQNSLEIFSIYILVKNKGICAFYTD